MHRPHRPASAACAAATALLASTACAQTSEPPDLPDLPPDVQVAEPPTATVGTAADSPSTAPLRLAFELGVGRIDLRDGGNDTGKRAIIDLRYTTAIKPGFGFTFSDRYDYIHPPFTGQPSSSNSLRELYVGWQPQEAAWSLDAGRINLRHGPAYGYNPTDYFRRGALRTVSTADPVALRERRLGTVMLRGGQLWDNGSVSLALAPKLKDDPSDKPLSPDLGATNDSSRALLTGSWRGGQSFSGQGLVLLDTRNPAQVGLNFTALASDALVLYGEASAGKQKTLYQQLLDIDADKHTQAQAAVGLTYTTPFQLALTVEGDYNRGGLDHERFRSLLAQGAPAYVRYFGVTQASQELGSRGAWLVYASQKGLGLKNLDLTAFVRGNANDQSRLWFGELRYRWDRFDAVLQYQRGQGKSDSEFGVLPYKQAVQLSVVFYL